MEVQEQFGAWGDFSFSQHVNNAYIAYFTMTGWFLTSQFPGASCIEEVSSFRHHSLRTREKGPSLLSSWWGVVFCRSQLALASCDLKEGLAELLSVNKALACVLEVIKWAECNCQSSKGQNTISFKAKNNG